MRVILRRARPDDAADLARLRWEWRREDHQSDHESYEDFVVALAQWWDDHRSSHVAVVAVDADSVVGMAWLALVGRVPDPGSHNRMHADMQSVYVQAPYRNQGVGTRMIREVIDIARDAGCDKLSVHSGRTALPLYLREGFTRIDQLLVLDLKAAE